MAPYKIGALSSYDHYGLMEFIRVYMEDDEWPPVLGNKVGYCLPIAEGKEPWLWSVANILFQNIVGLVSLYMGMRIIKIVFK